MQHFLTNWCCLLLAWRQFFIFLFLWLGQAMWLNILFWLFYLFSLCLCICQVVVTSLFSYPFHCQRWLFTNSISIKVGPLSKNAIKAKIYHLEIHLKLENPTGKKTKKRFSVLPQTNLILFGKFKTNSEIDACSTLQRSRDRSKVRLKRLYK